MKTTARLALATALGLAAEPAWAAGPTLYASLVADAEGNLLGTSSAVGANGGALGAHHRVAAIA